MPRLPRRPVVRDVLLAVVLTLVAEVELALLDPDLVEGPLLGHHLLNLLLLPAVGLRRLSPIASIAVASLGFAVQPLMGQAPIATPYLALLFLLASLGWYASLRTGALGVLLVLGSGLVYDATTSDFRWADLVVNAVIIVLVWAAAHLMRRATDRRVQAEVDADRRARAAVEAERTRIAQDLHDSLAHALTLITLQAGGARERAVEPAVADALGSIEQAGREALGDMHRFLGLLGPRDGAEAPGLGDLEDLVEGVRRHGLAVELDLDAGELPPSVATTVYRVVQEGLTNVVRHSDARGARVVVRRTPGELVAAVTDDGRPTAPRTGGSGRGLAGLRQRLALFDGSLACGAADGGWRLEARIPMGEAP